MDPLIIHEKIKSKLQFFLQSGKIPHIIFHGSSGSGKRTILYDFINKIYNSDKYKIKNNVMFVNCAHGKGIKFIREELKFFAKSNVQLNAGIDFKSIILMNADFLTIDAQSALRRCIELFSRNTRFFIIVENKNKLLNPILSRFCEIYVPEHLIDNKIMNLHQYNCQTYYPIQNKEWLANECKQLQWPTHKKTCEEYVQFVNRCYEKGVSAFDFVQYVESSDDFQYFEKAEFIVYYNQIKAEYRCEKLLMLTLLVHK